MSISEQDEDERIRTIIIKEERLVNKTRPNSISNVLKSDNKTEWKEQEQLYTSNENKNYLKKLKLEKHHKEKVYNKTPEKKLKQNNQFKEKKSSISRISVLLTLSRMLLAARNSPKSATNINSNEKVNTTCDYKERTSISTHGKSLRKETQDEEKTSPSKSKGASGNKKITTVEKNNDVNEIFASILLFALCSTLIIVIFIIPEGEKQKLNDCGFPPKISNGNYTIKITESILKQNESTPYTVIFYKCYKGYSLEPTEPSVVCKENGQWSHFPKCNKNYVDCEGKKLVNSKESSRYEYVNLVGFSQLVLCDYNSYGGGWIVILRRSGEELNFFRNFVYYEEGFGSLDKDFFLGLKNLTRITKAQRYRLRIELYDFEGDFKYAEYSSFAVGKGPEYKLKVTGFEGTAGDSMLYSDGMAFSARDKDQDGSAETNCAARFMGGWWYNKCHETNLLGKYYSKGHHKSYGDGINWKSWRGYYYSFKKVEMKIKYF